MSAVRQVEELHIVLETLWYRYRYGYFFYSVAFLEIPKWLLIFKIWICKNFKFETESTLKLE